MLTAILLILAQPSAALTPPVTVRGPDAMTRSQIRAYNATLSRDHPAYVRCRRNIDTGSLVKKTTSCRTNAEWRRVEQIGNDDARDTIDRALTSGSTNGI